MHRTSSVRKWSAIHTESEGMGLASDVVEESVPVFRPRKLFRDEAQSGRAHFRSWNYSF